MYSNKAKKLVRTVLGLTLLLTILNVFTLSSYATQWGLIPDTRLTWHDSLDYAPSIAQAQDGRIWIAWHSVEIGTAPNPDILYKVYNGSATFPWSPTKKLTTDPDIDWTPSITATADGNIWVVWSSNRTGNFEIYYKTYDGPSWSPDTRLTENASADEFPSIMQDKDGNIWVVWSSDRNGNFEIYYTIYNRTNEEWHAEESLTSNPAADEDPSIMQAQDGAIWIAWTRGDDLYYKVLFENMTEMIPETQLTSNETSSHPSIMQAQGGKIWIAWDSDRLEISEGLGIYCKTFYNGSSSEERITFNSADDMWPSIMQEINGTMWIAWTSTRASNFDIYYKTDSSPQHDHDMAIFSVTHDPNVTVAYQGLSISIDVLLQNQGKDWESFVVGCYANSTPIGNQTAHLPAGQLTSPPVDFTWNTLDVNPGTYTIIANVTITGQNDTDPADNTFIDGQVLVKILGDVNGEGVVDAFDFFNLSKAYGSGIGDPSWNPDCDFNRDDKVDTSDLFDINENYGKTI